MIQRFRAFFRTAAEERKGALLLLCDEFVEREEERRIRASIFIRIGSCSRRPMKLDPKLTEAHLQLGNLYSDQSQYAESIPEYLKALETKSDLPMLITDSARLTCTRHKRIKRRNNFRFTSDCERNSSRISTSKLRTFGSSSIRRRIRHPRSLDDARV